MSQYSIKGRKKEACGNTYSESTAHRFTPKYQYPHHFNGKGKRTYHVDGGIEKLFSFSFFA